MRLAPAVACSLLVVLPAASSSKAAFSPAMRTEEVHYAEGMVADELRPARVAAGAPVVVLVHGCCGDRRDMAALARALARRGAAVLNADVPTVADGGGWPASYEAVACATATARAVAAGLDGGPHEVALVGWSEGAFLAAAVTLGWRERDAGTGSPACPVDAAGAGPDILVGLGGYYGWPGEEVPADLVSEATIAWFGATPAENPAAWQRGNPYWWLATTPPAGAAPAAPLPRVRLIAAPGDQGTSAFQQALAARGADAATVTIPGATHLAFIQPRDVAGAEALAALSEALGLVRHVARRSP
jgi:acetyl esterase/lipase